MPEIPEMEIYKDYLNKWVKNKRLREISVLRPKCLNLMSEEFCNLTLGKTILAVSRRGKFLVFHLDDRRFLLAHMMLDGRLYLLTPQEAKRFELSKEMYSNAEALKERISDLPGKASVVFIMSDGAVLFFCSLTLGYLHYLDQGLLEHKLGELGVDPIEANFSEGFAQQLKGKKGMIKPWLMNPKNIAGVGNAYSNESLFRAGILPTRLIPSLSKEEKERLYHFLVMILRDSISLGGDMEEKFASWDTFTGGYNPYFQAYGRVGKPCVVCGETIQKKDVGGRNAFFCPNCQK